MTKKSKCLLIKAPCPKNGAPERGDYCPHWMIIEETNAVTGSVRARGVCGAAYYLEYLGAVSADVQEAAQSVQSNRNVVAEGFSALTGRPIRGDFQSLPAEVRAGMMEKNKATPSLPEVTEDDPSDE